MKSLKHPTECLPKAFLGCEHQLTARDEELQIWADDQVGAALAYEGVEVRE